MIVRSLELCDYRNYESLKVQFDPGVNLIYGDNGQGKTNVLEAVYECATGRSHRGSRDREVIRFEAEEAHVRLVFERMEIPTRLDLHLKKNKSKGAAVDGVPVGKTSELFGKLQVVFFSPEDLRIVKNAPAERRRFMDEELCQLDPLYTADLINYNRALLQRNNLLRDCLKDPSLKSLTEVWDEQLVKFGSRIIGRRANFLQELEEIAVPIHRELSEGKEELTLAYEPSAGEAAFGEKLFFAWESDLHTGSTSVGPHRDDFAIRLNGIDARRYGSQGQQRSAALSLKLAEIELVKRQLKDAPVLLLDDVLSELDGGRRERLLKSLTGLQTLITCTGLEEFVAASLDIDRRFYVKQGKMTEEEKKHE